MLLSVKVCVEPEEILHDILQTSSTQTGPLKALSVRALQIVELLDLQSEV